MASLQVHLAIAKLFVEKNPGLIKDKQAFYNGNVLPDLDPDKGNSHFGIRGERIDLIKRHKEKVGIKKFLELNKLDDDLNLGRFLHLYTDWAYYNKMFDDDYLRKTTLANFDTNHLYTIVELDKGIKNKYGILYGITSMEKQLLTVIDEWNKKQGSPKGKLLFSQEELLAFIEMISNIDLLCPVFLAGLSDCDTHDF